MHAVLGLGLRQLQSGPSAVTEPPVSTWAEGPGHCSHSTPCEDPSPPRRGSDCPFALLCQAAVSRVLMPRDGRCPMPGEPRLTLLPSYFSPSRFRGEMRLLRGLTLLLLLAVAEGHEGRKGRTRRELAPGLHEQGIRDAGGSYCESKDACCHGRDDGCTVPYLDTICYCDLFCNRTVSDCCPDFWEYCLGIEPPFAVQKGKEASGICVGESARCVVPSTLPPSHAWGKSPDTGRPSPPLPSASRCP